MFEACFVTPLTELVSSVKGRPNSFTRKLIAPQGEASMMLWRVGRIAALAALAPSSSVALISHAMSAIGPKRTFSRVAFDVAFGGKADMQFLQVQMSAYDPKRTLSSQ